MDITLAARTCKQIRDKADRSTWAQDRKQLATLYSFGLETKLEQARYALERLSNFTQPGHSKSVAHRRLEFYNDQWWCVVWSALDIMANLINVTEALGMAESDVYLHAVATNLTTHKAGTLVETRVTKLRSTDHFGALRAYRRCATHRRHICIISADVSPSLGYGDSMATSAVSTTVWYLCDDPLSGNATHAEHRQLPEYIEEKAELLLKDIKGILTAVRATI